MMRPMRGLLALALLLVGTACHPPAGEEPAGSPHSRGYMISFEEIQSRGQFRNLYDLVQTLRPQWLRTQGPDTFQAEQGQVQVHMDGNRMGGVDVLKTLAAAGVTSIQWVPPIEAAARYGLDHSHGAIVISTGPAH